MNNPFRNQDRDRQADRTRWTEQGQDGGWYGTAAHDRSRDGAYERNSPYAHGQGGYERSGPDGREEAYGRRAQGDFGAPREFDRDAYGSQSARPDWDRPNQTGSYGQGAFDAGRRDDWNTRYGYEQPQAGASYRTGRYEDHGRREPWQNASRPQQAGSHADFEPDYLHWREQQMAAYDRDYHEWRNEKRQKFSSDFEGWRTSRGPAVQAENSVVGDVTDGGTGSQAHAKEAHGDKPAKH